MVATGVVMSTFEGGKEVLKRSRNISCTSNTSSFTIPTSSENDELDDKSSRLSNPLGIGL